MYRHVPQSKWEKLQAALSTKQLGQRLLLWWDKANRLWGLRLMPFLKRIVLPGCAGVPLWEILRNFGNRDLWQSAKALSYSFLTAIPPLLVFLFSCIAYFPVDGVQDQLLLQLQSIIPDGLYGRVAGTIDDIMGHRHGSLLSIGFVTSIILAANGMYGMMMSFNFMDHESKERPLWLRYGVALFLVLLLYFLIVVVLTLLLGYQFLVKLLLARNILAESVMSLLFFNVGRWVILVFVTLLVMSLLYWIAPSRKRRIGFFSAGSVLSTGLLFLLTYALRAYLNVFGNYNILYGSIGTLLMVMFYVYANCVVILVGYGINVAVADSRGEESYTLKISKRNHGSKQREPYHRPSLRTDRDGYRQSHGSPIWFGPAGSVRHPRPGDTDGKDRDK